MQGIYIITNKINESQYIGLSNDIDRRRFEHFCKSSYNSKTSNIAKAIRKYGSDNFDLEVLEYVSDASSLPEREMYWIEKINPRYNMNKGGKGNLGRELSKVTREKISIKLKERWNAIPDVVKENIVNNQLVGPRKGHSVSVETREKLRQKNLDKKHSEETKLKISQKNKQSTKGNTNGCKTVACYKDGNLINVFKSIKLAAKELLLRPHGITDALKGRQKTYGGFIWKYWSVETIRDEFSGVGVSLPHVQVRGIRKDDDIVQPRKMENFGIIDKGYIQLAMRTGQYKFLNVDKVYEGELKLVNKLTGEIDFSGTKTSDKVIGYFAYIEMTNGFSKVLYRSVDEVKAHAKRFSKSFGTKSSPWETDFDAMAMKTVISNLLSHYGFLSVEMIGAVEADHDDVKQEYENEVAQNANIETVDFEDASVIDVETGEVKAEEVQPVDQDSDSQPKMKF